MNELLQQIESACKNRQLYIALFSALTLPDICGAISSNNGMATGQKYKDWFDEFVAQKYGGLFDGSNCYAFRCAALHQGRADHKHLGYQRVIFLAPDNNCTFHLNILNGALNLDLITFCKDVIEGVRKWMEVDCHGANFQKNMPSMLRRHVGGLPPYITGTDVFC